MSIQMSIQGTKDYLALDESDPRYAIDKLTVGSEEAGEIFNKHIEIYQQYSRFWGPRLQVAKKCMKYMRREIFSLGQKNRYEKVQGKIPIEPQEMKQVIDPLAARIEQTVRSASVSMEDSTPPKGAAAPEVVAKVLKWWQRQLKVEKRAKDALRNGLVTGYPQWLWFEKRRVAGGYSEELTATLLPSESTLCTPLFQEVDGSDIDDVLIVSFKSYAELYDIFPGRKEEHAKHLASINQDPEYQAKLFQLDSSITSEERKSIIYDRISAARYDSITGQCLVIERYHVLRKKQTIYVNEALKDAVTLPPEWDQWRKDAWLQANPDYALKISPEERTLWVTTISSDGFTWENDQHWFQKNGKLPGCCYIADMVDNLPVGKGEDMLPYILQVAVCETEAMHQVRVGTGTTTFVTEGALRHPSQLEKELSAEHGVVLLKKGHTPQEHVQTQQRKPNDTFHVMADRARDQLKTVHAVNDALAGVTHARQSNKAKQADLDAGLNPQNPYVVNFSEFNLNIAQLLCDMMPYYLTENMIVEVEDEYGNKAEPEEVNQVGFDMVTGQAQIIANDLTSAKYRITPVPGDDSPTTRESELKEFVQLLEAVGNTLFQIDPKILSNILLSWPNRFAREAGKSLLEYADQNSASQQQIAMAEHQAEVQKAQVKADIEREKINKPRFNVRLSPQDLRDAPMGFKVMMEVLNSMNAPTQQQVPAQAQMPSGEQPGAQGPVQQ